MTSVPTLELKVKSKRDLLGVGSGLKEDRCGVKKAQIVWKGIESGLNEVRNEIFLLKRIFESLWFLFVPLWILFEQIGTPFESLSTTLKTNLGAWP